MTKLVKNKRPDPVPKQIANLDLHLSNVCRHRKPLYTYFLPGRRRGEQIKRETIAKDYKDNKMLNNTYSYDQIDHRLEYSRDDRGHTFL